MNIFRRLFGSKRTPEAEPSPERAAFDARFQTLYREALANIATNMVKWRAVVEGRVKVDSVAEIADAHYWLGQHYTNDREVELAIHHSREALRLLDQIHSSDDAADRKAYDEWRQGYLKWIEGIRRRDDFKNWIESKRKER
jgi:hypothetical protein